MQLFSQRDPRWANHTLGYGGRVGTIGQFGCWLTVQAMIAWDAFADAHYLPPALDGVFIARRVYVQDATGTFDLLRDVTLALVWPKRFSVVAYAGFRSDLIAAAVPSKDTYAVLWISTPTVPTHFVLAASRNGSAIFDPWTGRAGLLSGYGGPGAIHRTILVRRLAQVAPAPPPVATPVIAPVPPPAPATVPLPPSDLPPTPLPLPTPPPEPPGGWLGLWAWIRAVIRAAVG